MDDACHLLGIFTDGDLRRTFEKSVALLTNRFAELMSQGRTIEPDQN